MSGLAAAGAVQDVPAKWPQALLARVAEIWEFEVALDRAQQRVVVIWGLRDRPGLDARGNQDGPDPPSTGTGHGPAGVRRVGPGLLIAAGARIGIGSRCFGLVERDDQKAPARERGRAEDARHVVAKPGVGAPQAAGLPRDARRVVPVVAEVGDDERVAGSRGSSLQVLP